MAITIYKYAYHVDWEAEGVGITRMTGSGTTVDLTNYYTIPELQTPGASIVHFDNITEAYHNNLLNIQGGLDTSSGDSSGLDAEYYHLDEETYLRVITWEFIDSLIEESDGTIHLVNDEDVPGPGKYYGTDAGGIKGWFDLPAGGSGSGGVGDSLWQEDSIGDLTPITVGAGIYVDGIYIKDSTIYTNDGSLSHLTIHAGDASGGAGTDAGNLILRAGDALGDIGSIAGKIYLVPGDPYAGYGTVYIGDANYGKARVTLQVTGSSANVGLQIFAKGSENIYIGENTSQDVTIASTTTFNKYTTHYEDLYFGASRNATIRGATGLSADGWDLTVKGGGGYYSGNYNGGDLFLYGGDPSGTGVRGNVYFGDGSNGYLPEADSDEVYVVTYDPDTGKLGYTQLI